MSSRPRAVWKKNDRQNIKKKQPPFEFYWPTSGNSTSSETNEMYLGIEFITVLKNRSSMMK